jgi:hypothetical protein
LKVCICWSYLVSEDRQNHLQKAKKLFIPYF